MLKEDGSLTVTELTLLFVGIMAYEIYRNILKILVGVILFSAGFYFGTIL